MFRFVLLSVSFFVGINQSSGVPTVVQQTIKLRAGPVEEKVFSPPTTTVGETTPTSTRATVGTTTATPTTPLTEPYRNKLIREVSICNTVLLSGMNDAIAKEQDALDAKVLKVLTSFETQRRALVKGIRNFGFSTILSTDTRFAIADKVSGIINCLKSAELALEYLPIGITGDFSYPESDTSFESDMLTSFGYKISIAVTKIYISGETCSRLMDLTCAKLISKISNTFNVMKKCALSFTSVNMEDIKAFESRAALALKQVDTVVKAVNSCKWSISKGIETCATNIIRVADASSICDDTSALSPILGNMLTASFNAMTSCIDTANLSGVSKTDALSIEAEATSKCGPLPTIDTRSADGSSLKSVDQIIPIQSTARNQSYAGF